MCSCIDMADWGLDPESVATLFDAVADNRAMTSVDISEKSNAIGLSGVTAILHALQHNSRLTNVKCDRDAVDDWFARKIENQVLCSLYKNVFTPRESQQKL